MPPPSSSPSPLPSTASSASILSSSSPTKHDRDWFQYLGAGSSGGSSDGQLLITVRAKPDGRVVYITSLAGGLVSCFSIASSTAATDKHVLLVDDDQGFFVLNHNHPLSPKQGYVVLDAGACFSPPLFTLSMKQVQFFMLSLPLLFHYRFSHDARRCMQTCDIFQTSALWCCVLAATSRQTRSRPPSPFSRRICDTFIRQPAHTAPSCSTVRCLARCFFALSHVY